MRDIIDLGVCKNARVYLLFRHRKYQNKQNMWKIAEIRLKLFLIYKGEEIRHVQFYIIYDHRL